MPPLVAVHTACLTAQAYANSHIDAAWSIGTTGFAGTVFLALPIVALIVKRQQPRIAFVLLLGCFAASCAFYAKFSLLNHRIFFPLAEPTVWSIVFRFLSYLLVAVDALGAVMVALLIKASASSDKAN